MHIRLHMPSSINTAEGLTEPQRERLQQIIMRAFTRAANGLDLREVRIELVSAPEQPVINNQAGTQSTQGDVKEHLDELRLHDGAYYKVPGYDSGGKPVSIPVHSSGAWSGVSRKVEHSSSVHVTTGTTISTPDGDNIYQENFPELPVIQARRTTYYVGGSPYVEAQNLARALRWGAYLFGANGYAILQPKGASPTGPFYVAQLSDQLKLKGESQPFQLQSGERAAGVDASMLHLRDYLSVVVVDGSGNFYFGNRQTDPWNYVMFKRVLADVPASQSRIESIQDVSQLLMQQAAEEHGDQGMLEIIVRMDRTLFVVMPWEKRVEYLILLLDAWTNEREETAILEIIHATRSESELEALFALLRERGEYEKLFDDLDGRVFELLQMLGEYRADRPLDWHYLVELLVQMGLMPSLQPDAIHDLELMAAGMLDWLQSTWDGIRFLLTRPDEVIEGLGHLAELLWIIQKAQYGDVQAIMFVGRMVIGAGTAIAKAIRGLKYAEELGTTYGKRGASLSVSASILKRLQAALIFEVLSWFIGIGEIRAAIGAFATLPERLAALMDVVRSIRLLGKVAEVGKDVTKVERVLMALSHLAEVGEEARMLRLVDLLPQEHLALLEQITRAAEGLQEGAGIEALRKALHGHSELLKGIDELGDVFNVVGRVEGRASLTGGMTAEMTEGLHMLLRHTGWKRATLLSLIEDIPGANLPEFLHTLKFVKPVYLQKWGVQALKELAARPRVLTFIREAGSDLLEVAFGRTGHSWEKFDLFLDGLAAERNRIGNAAEYQRLLDRLGQGEAAAFDQIADATYAQLLAEAVQKGEEAALALKRLQEGNYRYLLEEMQDLAEENMASYNHFASELVKLKEKELAGLEQVARLESGEADWKDVLSNVSGWTAGDRNDLLELMADIGPRSQEGLDTVLRGIISRKVKKAGAEVTGVQGSWGQLYAARTLINRYGATSLYFEVAAVRREIDIVAQTGSGWLHVEVKTNLENLAGEVTASFEREQIIKDLVAHAGTEYKDMLYLYHPGVAGQLEGHGQRMLRLFDGEELTKLLKQRGIDADKARQSLQRWLAAGGLTTYSF